MKIIVIKARAQYDLLIFGSLTLRGCHGPLGFPRRLSTLVSRLGGNLMINDLEKKINGPLNLVCSILRGCHGPLGKTLDYLPN